MYNIMLYMYILQYQHIILLGDIKECNLCQMGVQCLIYIVLDIKQVIGLCRIRFHDYIILK